MFTEEIQYILRRKIQRLHAEVRKTVQIQNCMYDSVTQNFDRVSGLQDNGLTPLQGLEDNHPVKITTPENTIDDDVVDIRTIYPPWSPDTNDV